MTNQPDDGVDSPSTQGDDAWTALTDLTAVPPSRVVVRGGFSLLGLLVTGFWIWMIIDCAVNETNEGNTKIVWILIIIFTHGLGALLYFLIRRPQRKAELGR